MRALKCCLFWILGFWIQEALGFICHRMCLCLYFPTLLGNSGESFQTRILFSCHLVGSFSETVYVLGPAFLLWFPMGDFACSDLKVLGEAISDVETGFMSSQGAVLRTPTLLWLLLERFGAWRWFVMATRQQGKWVTLLSEQLTPGASLACPFTRYLTLVWSHFPNCTQERWSWEPWGLR